MSKSNKNKIKKSSDKKRNKEMKNMLHYFYVIHL